MSEAPTTPVVGETASTGVGTPVTPEPTTEPTTESASPESTSPGSSSEKPSPPVFPEAPDSPEKPGNRDLESRIRDLENTLAATRAGLPLALVPHHGGGKGTDIAETWSQADQEAARAG